MNDNNDDDRYYYYYSNGYYLHRIELEDAMALGAKRIAFFEAWHEARGRRIGATHTS